MRVKLQLVMCPDDDAGDTVRALQHDLRQEAEYILDWVHITMKLTVLDQYAKGVVHHDQKLGECLRDQLERLKWSLRHGQVDKALGKIGERYRCGKAIATGFVESTVNQVVSKRFCKQQQMQWSTRGAHLLLQTRVKTLNGELISVFKRW